jgi:hypothetical protein
MLLFFCISISLWQVSKKGGTKFTDILFPPLLVERFRASSFSKKYLREALQKPWVTILIFINIVPLLWLLRNLSDWFNPVLNLDEMKTYSGVIDNLHRGGRKDRVDILKLRVSSGEVAKFFFYHSEEAYLYMNNLTDKDVVKIWAQVKWRKILPSGERCLRQLQHNEYIVYKYDKERLLQTTSFGKKSSAVCALVIFCSCMIVWFKFKDYGGVE